MKEKKGTCIKNEIIFLAPVIICFSCIVLIPFIYSFATSLTKWNGISKNIQWNGIANYKKILSDKAFLNSFIYTLKNMFVVTVIANALGLLFALILTCKIRGSQIFRTTLILPNILSGIVLGFVWKFIFSDVLPQIGETLNCKFLELSWLARPTSAFWSVAIVSIWQMTGYVMLIYIAGIIAIPGDLIESAYVDGAGNMQVIKKIILPHLKPSFVVCIFWTISKTLLSFDLQFSLTQGGPFKSTETLAINIYQEAFEKNNYGVGNAKAILFFVTVVVFSLLQNYLTRRNASES